MSNTWTSKETAQEEGERERGEKGRRSKGNEARVPEVGGVRSLGGNRRRGEVRGERGIPSLVMWKLGTS